MRALAVSAGFGFDALRFEQRTVPEPGPKQVLVQIRTVGLNYRDTMVVTGEYNPRQALPLVVGSDALGHVVKLGDGATRFPVGARVCPIFAQAWLDGPPTRAALRTTLGSPLDGTLTEYAVFDEDGLVAAPSHLSDEEAGSLACAGVTAFSALSEAGIGKHSTVLLLGTGGVSIFALAFAKLLGARTLLVSKSSAKLERARALGADAVSNYVDAPDWAHWAREQTHGEGVDCVLDVGGAGTLERSLRAVRPGGHVALIGVLAGSSQPLDVRRITMQNIRVQGILVGSRRTFESMNALIERSSFRPTLDQIFGFDEAPQALQYLRRGEHFGKVCVRIAS